MPSSSLLSITSTGSSSAIAAISATSSALPETNTRPTSTSRDHDQEYVDRALFAAEVKDGLRDDQPADEQPGERHPLEVRREQRPHRALELSQSRIGHQRPQALEQPQHDDRHCDEPGPGARGVLRRDAARDHVEDRAEHGAGERPCRVQRQVAQARDAHGHRRLQQFEHQRKRRAEDERAHEAGPATPARLQHQCRAEPERRVQQQVVEHVAATGALPADPLQCLEQRRAVLDEAERIAARRRRSVR